MTRLYIHSVRPRIVGDHNFQRSDFAVFVSVGTQIYTQEDDYSTKVLTSIDFATPPPTIFDTPPNSTPITARLVPPATEDALRLLLDDGEARARIAASSSSTPHLPVAPPPRCAPSPPSPSQTTPQHEHEVVEQPPEWEGGDMGHAAGKPKREGFGKKRMCWGEAGNGELERGDGREGCVGEQLRWRLWHKGEVR